MTTTTMDLAQEIEKLPDESDWRAGKPKEDPHKMKRWGFVTAKPSEHLIHVRGGRITTRSGQGASCFKWPWDAVAVIPTSLQRLGFVADQVTAEKVGVEVRGFAVYRIADPLLAFRVLNFSYPERAQQKLEQTLTDMFVGATRRIVASLPVQDCLCKRKAALAEELLSEIAPVVGGEGHPDDPSTRGWGVVIDTIEIQEVRILSETVFHNMQAPFRAELDRQAREARAMSEKAIAEREVRCRRETELAQLAVEAELERERRRAQAERVEEDNRLAIRQVEMEAERADATRGTHARLQAAQQARGELERGEASLQQELRKLAIEVDRIEGLARAEIALREAAAHQQRSEADVQLRLADQLPKLAEALGERMGPIQVTQIGNDVNPLAQVATSLSTLLELARPATKG